VDAANEAGSSNDAHCGHRYLAVRPVVAVVGEQHRDNIRIPESTVPLTTARSTRPRLSAPDDLSFSVGGAAERFASVVWTIRSSP